MTESEYREALQRIVDLTVKERTDWEEKERLDLLESIKQYDSPQYILSTHNDIQAPITWPRVIPAAVVSICCILIAGYMAINHVGHWGWFLGAAVLSTAMPLNKLD